MGPEIRMNTRAWDLAIDEDTGRLTLYTAYPDDPTASTLQNLQTMLNSENDLRGLMKLSLSGTSGIYSVMGNLDIDEDQINKFLSNNKRFSAVQSIKQDHLRQDGLKIQKDRGIRIMPFFEEKIGGTEGFYIAYLQFQGSN